MGSRGNGVQWLMELEAKLDGAKAMVKELSASEKAADQADQALKKMEGHTFRSLTKSVFTAELGMKALEKTAELALWSIKKLGGAIEIAAGEERLDRVFANMLGGEEARETVDYMEKFADVSELLEGSVKAAGAELLRSGVHGAAFRNALALAADVAAQSTDKMAGFQRAIDAVGRTAKTGRMELGTLYQIGLNEHEVLAQMSSDLGMTKETIKKKLAEGALEGALAMESIFTVMERKTGKQLGGLGLEMAKGMQSSLEKVMNLPSEMAQTLKNTQGFRDLEDSLGNFLEIVKPRLIEGTGLMGKMFDTVGARLKNIDWDKVVDKFEVLVELAGKWVDVLDNVATATEKIATGVLALPSLGEKIGDVLGNAEILLKEGRVGQTEEERHQKWLDVEWERRQAALRGRDIAVGAAVGMEVHKVKAREAGADLVGAADKGMRDAGEIHSPSRLFERHGRMLAEGLATGLERGSARAAAAAGSMMPIPSTAALTSVGGGGINAGGITVNLSVEVPGGSGSSAEEIAHEVQAILPSALLGALEQIAVQAGVN
ncbi:MAG: hypothetical protein JXP73_03270 [Deltaproteobacteria bacterium]|nr:hypothetical protein [Deltaproteobacteria bacterium]